MSMYMCGVVPSLFGCFFEFHPYYVHFCWLDYCGFTSGLLSRTCSIETHPDLSLPIPFSPAPLL